MPPDSVSSVPVAAREGARTFAGAPGALLGVRHQLILAAYWFSLSFHGGALLGVAVPAQILGLAGNSQKVGALALLGGFSGLITMVVQPAAGALSDLSRSRWGRRRPYLVVGAVLDVAGLALMAAASNLSLLFAGFLLASFGSGVSGAAYQAYIPDHVPPRQIGEASGYMGAMTMLGTIGSFGVAAFTVAPSAAGAFYVVTIGVMAAGAALTALAIPDPPMPAPSWYGPGDRAGRMAALPEAGGGAHSSPPAVPGWRVLWLEPWRDADFAWVFATRSMMMLALYTLFTFVEYYVRDVVHVTQFVQGAAAVAGVATVAALGGGLLTGWLSDRIGRKWMVCGAGCLMAGALAVLAVAHQLNVVLGVGVAFGLALGAYTAVDWALAVDVLPDQAFAAKDLGLWGISTNLPQTLAPFVGGAVLAVLAPYGEATGYGALFLGAAVCAALSSVFVWRIRSVR